MVKKRKDGVEVMKLTKVAKSWEFTCTFCFKKFPSAQAMGGHQNAHRSERLEEKRLLVRDPITHRKRAFLQADADSNNINNGGDETETESEMINFLPPNTHFNLDLTLKL